MVPDELDGVMPVKQSERKLVEQVTAAIPSEDFESADMIAARAGVDKADALRVIKRLAGDSIRLEQSAQGYRLRPAE